MATTPIAGTDGRVSVAGTILYFESWDLTMTAGDIKTTNFEGAGYATRIGGIRECKVHGKAYWDVGNNPHASPPGIIAGDIIGPFALYVSKANGVQYTITTALVTEVTASQTVEGRADFEFTAMSTAAYTLAGGYAGNS